MERRFATCLAAEKEKQTNLELERLDIVAKNQAFEEWTGKHGKGSANLASFVTQQLVWYVRLRIALCPREDHLTRFWNHSVICLDTFGDRRDVRGLPCYHVFHSDCLQVWFLKRKFTCPLCKAPFVDPPVEAEVMESGANV